MVDRADMFLSKNTEEWYTREPMTIESLALGLAGNDTNSPKQWQIAEQQRLFRDDSDKRAWCTEYE